MDAQHLLSACAKAAMLRSITATSAMERIFFMFVCILSNFYLTCLGVSGEPETRETEGKGIIP